jgi:hypothetical protein
MNNIPPNIYDVPLRDNSRIQIIETLRDLPRARKHQYAAFVRDECTLLVWADTAGRVIDDAQEIENKIIALIWDDNDAVHRYEKTQQKAEELNLDLEDGYVPCKRKRVLLQPILVCGVCPCFREINNQAWVLIFFFIGSGLKILLREIAITGQWYRLCFLVTSPILFFAMVSRLTLQLY